MTKEELTLTQEKLTEAHKLLKKLEGNIKILENYKDARDNKIEFGSVTLASYKDNNGNLGEQIVKLASTSTENAELYSKLSKIILDEVIDFYEKKVEEMKKQFAEIKI